MSGEKAVLLLGRRDEPTDGVEDYCHMLRDAAARRDLSFEIARVNWAEKGWREALTELRKRASAEWRGRWVFLQFTTLAWSRRGFPLRAPGVLRLLRQSGARPGVVFHDLAPLPGRGLIGRAREFFQSGTFRQLYTLSELAVFTVPINKISWLPLRREKAIFIPVGSNCPEPLAAARDNSSTDHVVAVYSITGGANTQREVADLATALTRASYSAGPIRLLLFGRGSKEAERSLRAALADANVTVESLGLLSPARVTEALSSAEVLLFVRGQISTRRGSVIAGIACALPIVCYSGPETAWPITEAGILAVSIADSEGLASSLKTVLTDAGFRKTLAERSQLAYERYFSWSAIAGQFVSALCAPLNDKETIPASIGSKSIEIG